MVGRAAFLLPKILGCWHRRPEEEAGLLAGYSRISFATIRAGTQCSKRNYSQRRRGCRHGSCLHLYCPGSILERFNLNDFLVFCPSLYE